MQKGINKLSWANNIRLIAIIAVIFLHVSAEAFVLNKVPTSSNWQIANVYDSLVRFCVPLFLMLTGALLLNKEDDLFFFIKKRLIRIIIPFLFWSCIYIIYKWPIYSTNDNNVNSFFLLKEIYNQFAYGAFYHLWYVYMIIGVYLFVPIIQPWINKAKKKDILYFISIWILTLIFNLPIISNLNTNIDLHYFSGFLGYTVLGYYLGHKLPISERVNKIAIALFSAGFIITSTGTYILTAWKGLSKELLYSYLTPNVLILSIGAFILIKNFDISVTNQYLIKLRNLISKHSYGIYLVHVLVLKSMYSIGINYQITYLVLSIPIVSAICLFTSLLIIYTINKLPYGKYVAG